jgi:Glycosyl transferases group 1
MPIAREPGREFECISRRDANVLLLSLRRVEDLVAYCAQYEFEDVIAQVTAADMAAPRSIERVELSRKAYKLVRCISGSRRLARAIAPRWTSLQLRKEYELFLPVFSHVHQLFALRCVPGWRQRCRKAACYITEAWQDRLPGDYLLELLRDFDHVFLGARQVVEIISQRVGRPCSYLPQGVDALLFCPWPDPPARSIDVCNIGRRSPVTHQNLLEAARREPLFYYYDTVKPAAKQITFRVGDEAEHRFLLANLLKRSRYFIANRARVNEPELVRGHDEIAGRFFEGAAAGAVMLGEAPRVEEFRQRFDWPDAVIPMGFHSSDVKEQIRALNADPERQARIRNDNVYNSLLRHDWVHRLRVIMDAVGVAPTPEMLERRARLETLAGRIRQA